MRKRLIMREINNREKIDNEERRAITGREKSIMRGKLIMEKVIM
jgi:hypothetical protein